MAVISRRCSTVLITLLAVFLLGTVLVLSTVRAYYSIDSAAYILPEELGTWEQIKLGTNPDAVSAAAFKAAAAASPSVTSAAVSPSLTLTSGGNRNDGAPRASATPSESGLPAPIIEYNPHNNSIRPWDLASPPERIPRIIHQTWKDNTLPAKWQGLKDECRKMHPDYEYMLWTDADSRTFIQKNYEWFLPIFDAYPYPIQRADAIRYFVLHYYGGIYMDLDIGCLRRFDPLLRFEIILPKTIPVGVSNDLMLAKKGHPFMDLVIHNLVAFNHQYLTNYPTVMFSTGPMFLSASYGMFVSKHGSAKQSTREQPEAGFAGLRILPKSLYGKNAKPGEAPDAFFRHLYGSSWHSNDAGFLIFLRDHGTLLMIIGFYIVAYGALRTLLPRCWKGRTPRRGLLGLFLGGGGGSGSGAGGSGGSSAANAGTGLGDGADSPGGSGAGLGAPGSGPAGEERGGGISSLFPFRKRGNWIALRTSDPDALEDSDGGQSGGGSGASPSPASGGRRPNQGGGSSVRWKRSSDLEFV
ncbi:unnamed protein product [Tilletia laevis]|uniref:Glycosyltransferase family 32 protein n=2 Tax=Tilletia TaxID=13289 RepID=A0A177VCI8_9BASI|nr:hypothetical protein CF336_g8462 [Tilletia laevis]KAE8243587.1 hypothetical protein A4X03_0g7716 [Tilletia caries]KAE8184215.1 hypothetical protein CF335_g8091 [Tilletia laevis]CAD6888607.1 unnamed protein product [Tilletia caries]CAD6913193.1 unnamed protein product [Tilletia caries]